MSGFYPVVLKLTGQKCLVVGGGTVAWRKIQALLTVEAQITMVSPEAVEELRLLADSGQIRWLQREFRPDDIAGCLLVISATDNHQLNQQVSLLCQEKGILVNVVDVPEACSFYVPAVVRQGDLTIAVSTGGKSPALARKIREQLTRQFGPEYRSFLHLLGEARVRVLAECEPEKRKQIFEELVNSDILDLLRRGEYETAKERIGACIS